MKEFKLDAYFVVKVVLATFFVVNLAMLMFGNPDDPSTVQRLAVFSIAILASLNLVKR